MTLSMHSIFCPQLYLVVKGNGMQSQTERAVKWEPHGWSQSRACSPPVGLSLTHSHFVVKTTPTAWLSDTDMDFMTLFLNKSSHKSPCTYCRVEKPYSCSLLNNTQQFLSDRVPSTVVFKCKPTVPLKFIIRVTWHWIAWSVAFSWLLGFHIHTKVGFGGVTHLKHVQLYGVTHLKHV